MYDVRHDATRMYYASGRLGSPSNIVTTPRRVFGGWSIQNSHESFSHTLTHTHTTLTMLTIGIMCVCVVCAFVAWFVYNRAIICCEKHAHIVPYTIAIYETLTYYELLFDVCSISYNERNIELYLYVSICFFAAKSASHKHTPLRCIYRW